MCGRVWLPKCWCLIDVGIATLVNAIGDGAVSLPWTKFAGVILKRLVGKMGLGEDIEQN